MLSWGRGRKNKINIPIEEVRREMHRNYWTAAVLKSQSTEFPRLSALVEDNVLWVGFSFMTSDRILNSLFFVDWPLGISASPNVPLGSKENSCLKICLTCAKRICQSDSCLWSQGTFLCQ